MLWICVTAHCTYRFKCNHQMMRNFSNTRTSFIEMISILTLFGCFWLVHLYINRWFQRRLEIKLEKAEKKHEKAKMKRELNRKKCASTRLKRENKWHELGHVVQFESKNSNGNIKNWNWWKIIAYTTSYLSKYQNWWSIFFCSTEATYCIQCKIAFCFKL